jgi:hypothetical protein
LLAALWGFGSLSAAVAATAEPTVSEPPKPKKPFSEPPPEEKKPVEEPEEKPEPERVPTTVEGPVPRSPFTPITRPGDPFGLTPYTGIAAGVPPGAAGIRVGPAIVYPSISASMLYDDNIFATNTNKQGSFGTIVSPAVRAELRPRGGHVLGVSYSADIIRFAESNADNFNVHNLRADGNLIFTTRARLALDAHYIESVDRRGTTDRPVGTEPDEWEAKGASGKFTYGAPGARGRIDLEAGRRDLTYKTNRAVTAPFDHEITYVGGAFYWRFMPKTSLLFEARHTDIDYESSDLSSQERLLVVGLTWEATAQTTGIVRVGHLRKEFDAPGRETFTGLSWEGSVRWSPRTYSNVEFTTAQHTSESSGFGDYTLSRVAFATWRHNWTSRTQSAVRLGYRNDDYGGAGVNRDEDTTTAGAGLQYQFRRWLRFEGRYDHVRRSSNIPGEEYNRNIFMFTVGASL